MRLWSGKSENAGENKYIPSTVHSTGAEDRACFKASKLACASVDHTKRADRLPSVVSLSRAATSVYLSTELRE